MQLRNSKHIYLGEWNDRKRYSLLASIGAIQMRELGGVWEDIDPTIEELDTDGSTINFTKTPMGVKIGTDSKRRIYPDKADLSYWIEFQKPYPSMGAPTRLNRWFYWNFTHAIIGIQVNNTGVKFGFRLKDNLAPTSITIPFTTQGITRQGRFLYHDGKVIAELQKPIATGSNLDAFGEPVQKDCDIVFGAGEVTISLDPTGLDYPIDIDPTIDVQVEADADDGYYIDRPYYTNSSSDFRVGQSGGELYATHYRFTSITMPQNSTIIVAYLSLYEYASGGSALTKIRADDREHPVAPTNTATFEAIVPTTAGVDEDGDPGGTGWHNTASIVSVIEELTASYAYAGDAEDAIQTMHYDDGSADGNYRRSKSHDDTDGSLAPQLYIEYTTPAAGGGRGWAQK